MPTDSATPSPGLDEAEAGSPSSHRLARASDWLPLLPMLGGVVLLFYLLRFPSPHVHFSTDGALKEYVIRMWLAIAVTRSSFFAAGAG